MTAVILCIIYYVGLPLVQQCQIKHWGFFVVLGFFLTKTWFYKTRNLYNERCVECVFPDFASRFGGFFHFEFVGILFPE